MSNVNDENKTKTINGKFVKVESNKNLDGKKIVAEIEVRKGGGTPRPKMPAWFKEWTTFEFKPFCEETKASFAKQGKDIKVLKQNVKVMKADIDVLKENDKVMKADIEVLKENDKVMKADIEVLKENDKVMKADIEVLKENDKKQGENINQIFVRLDRLEENDEMIFGILDKNNIK